VHRSKPSERTIAVSLVTSVFDAGQLVGGPLFGAVIEAHGHRAAFGVASAIAAFGLVLFIVWDRRALTAHPG
jgi:predicted MFS family arabinose efflux permease